ncbi:fimbrial biogenesis chaperone [Proteus myxofaciens]|uniref:FimC family chaperone protein n=1 Tax=Proteus myxofaciens ATCC 19692 TaxID=1354337 RepID=A0A198GEE9_9GAMM|nr:molecular chaperone [Proteus myxofaciens]OAT34601.1 FimC family chaperone protein [Proteus myxofaciens ATCC 19692]
MQIYSRSSLLAGLFTSLVILVAPMTQAIAQESNGVKLESTRVIYPGTAKNGINFTVTNQTSDLFLLQARVIPWGKIEQNNNKNSVQDIAVNTENKAIEETAITDIETPFIVLPPLTRFEPEEAKTLYIRLTKNNLPQDRESVFTLSLKTIPSQSTPENAVLEGKTKMVLAIENNLKLFYRPEGIENIGDEDRAKALSFSLQGSSLIVKNPTPYYITLNKVTLDSHEISLEKQRMLTPFSDEIYPLPSSHYKKVSWQIIDDYGQSTPLETKSLN